MLPHISSLLAPDRALAQDPDPNGILTTKALSGLSWWTLDIVDRLRELNSLADNSTA